MGTRIVGLGVVLSILLLMPSMGAEPSGSEGTAPTRKEFDELKKRVDETQAIVVAMDKKFATLKDFEALKKQYVETDAQFGQLLKDFEETKRQFEEIKRLYQETDRVVGQISKGVNEVDENGRRRHVPDISGNMKYTSFRTELTSAVHDVMRQTGTLRLYNKMPTTQVMRLAYADHRVDYVLLPGEYRDVPVGVGTLTTQLLNSAEGPKNWTIAPPSYFQKVDIVPREYARVVVEPEVRIIEPFRIVSTVIEPPVLYSIVR